MSDKHRMSDGSEIQVHVDAMHHVELFLRGIIHHLIDWTIILPYTKKYSWESMETYENLVTKFNKNPIVSASSCT